MWYVIYSKDSEDSLQARLDARPAHIERLNVLLDQGRLLLAGPRPAIDSPDPGPAGFLGSLVVAEFDSLEDARAWADEDPYIESGAYQSVEVTPFNLVMPK
jgi:uncharacterized protein YciI